MDNIAADRTPRGPQRATPPDNVMPSSRRALNTTDGVVSATAQAWRPEAEPHTVADRQDDAGARPGTPLRDARDVSDAAPWIRDNFLRALDAANDPLSRQIAVHLTSCCNPLPGMVCTALGLERGSTYGCAARLVLGIPAPGGA